MDSLDFGWSSAARQGGITRMNEAAAPWLCIDGSGSTLITAMLGNQNTLQLQVYYHHWCESQVERSYYNLCYRYYHQYSNYTEGGATPKPTVPHRYDRVLRSLPLSVLGQNVDISKAGFDYQQANAIRALHYDCSVKVGIRFKKQWWRLPPYQAHIKMYERYDLFQYATV